MKTAMIIYSSKYGQTAKISEFVRDRLEHLGYCVELLEITSSSSPIAIGRPDLIFVGTPVYAGRFPNALVSALRERGWDWFDKNTALFTVSLNAADARPEARPADRALIERFCRAAHWRPRHAASFAGALKYRSYNWLIRLLMKRISAKAGGPTETSRDYEMTDWKAISAFVDEVTASQTMSAAGSSAKVPAAAI